MSLSLFDLIGLEKELLDFEATLENEPEDPQEVDLADIRFSFDGTVSAIRLG